nr:hypothetical protein Hi04_10k_c4773_00004 [uncultured bacterium]
MLIAPRTKPYQLLPLSQLAAKAKLAGALPAHAGRSLVALAGFSVGQALVVPPSNEDQRGQRIPFAPHFLDSSRLISVIGLEKRKYLVEDPG